jgi:hypothetical protein
MMVRHGFGRITKPLHTAELTRLFCRSACSYQARTNPKIRAALIPTRMR